MSNNFKKSTQNCPLSANTGGSRKHPRSLPDILDEANASAEIKELIQLIRGTRSRTCKNFAAFYEKERSSFGDIERVFGIQILGSSTLYNIRECKTPVPTEVYTILRIAYGVDLNAFIAGAENGNIYSDRFIGLNYIKHILRLVNTSMPDFLQKKFQELTDLIKESYGTDDRIFENFRNFIRNEPKENSNMKKDQLMKKNQLELFFNDVVCLELGEKEANSFSLKRIMERTRKRPLQPSIYTALHYVFGIDLNEFIAGSPQGFTLQDIKALLL